MKKRNLSKEDHLPEEDLLDLLAEDHLDLLAEDHLGPPAGDRQNVEDHLGLPAGDRQNVEDHLVDRRKARLLVDQVAVDHLSVEDLHLADQVAVGHLSVEDHLEVRNVDHPADLSVDHQSEKLRINISTRFHYLEFYNVVNSKSFSVDLRLSNFQAELVPVH
jgi:hypothetical protein